WKSWVREESTTNATLFLSGGGALNCTNDGVWTDVASGLSVTRITNGGSFAGFQVLHLDGSVDIYTYQAPVTPKIFFVEYRQDMHSNRVNFYYSSNGTSVRLSSVVDAAGQTSTLSYTSNAWSAHLIGSVS